METKTPDSELIGKRTEEGNFYLRLARQYAGVNQAEVCRKTGIQDTHYGQIEKNITFSTPENRKKICDYFSSVYKKTIDEETLFPEEMNPGRKAAAYRAEDALNDACPLDSLSMLEKPYTTINAKSIEENRRSKLEYRMEKILTTLTPREEDVAYRRFGITGNEQSIDRIGESYSVSKERVKQIMGKALGELRHPTRSRALKEFFRPSEDDCYASGIELLQVMAHENNTYEKKNREQVINRKYGELTQREEEVHAMITGSCGRKYTLDEIAHHYNVPRVRARQIVQNAERKLKPKNAWRRFKSNF
jgi:DNA-directed RNA polymerase specialized sigma subunit